MNDYKPQPTEPRQIQPPRYDAVVDPIKMTVTIIRNDKDGKLSYEKVKEFMPVKIEEVKDNGQTN